MLIDARHREETRVAVTKGNRIEEFDFESAEHKQLKGNIYLAKVTRVEPSLQAAFVEYGGNRHGFLAFSEIHPDYYQIPKEDRDALLREEAEHAAAAAQRAEEDLDELEGDVADVEYHDEDDNGDNRADRDDDRDDHDDGHDDHDDRDDHGDAENGDAQEGAEGSEENKDGRGDRRGRGRGRGNNNRKGGRGRSRRGDDEDGENRMSLRRRYKIQDVIRRRQVMLVQVVKEERGNKGAALTTYLSLAGRYCVLMPNTMHGGGISRKISNGADRRKLKAMIDELALPPTMGCIVRTAGMSRTKVEIKRDFDYLARLWDEIRENTLGSSAPALIHSDSDLVKRAIRDIYHKDIEEVLVEGDDGYKAAKQFMKLLMPSHARRVKQYADPVSLYQRYGVEDQLAGMLNPVVQLKSGGYLVINPTEALVSIDINSGRSTREHNIEQTALSTNLEAAAEIARQLRLRDMAGLVVIDFIDMDHGSNVRKVERAMKDALKNDRARIQVGRISGFGLMEMSRQRLRTGVLEASTRPCPHCEGTGLVRTASSAGLSALRLIEEEAARGKGNKITLRASQEATFYLLNEKRRELREIEELYGVTVEILPDGETEGARMAVEVSGPPPIARRSFAPIAPIEDDDDEDYPDDEEEEAEEEAAEERPARSRDREEGTRDREEGDADGEGRKRRRRRRRGRRGRRDDEGNEIAEGGEGGDDRDGDSAEADEGETAPAEAVEAAPDVDAEEAEAEAKPRRRRGGRGRKKADAVETTDDAAVEAEVAPVETVEAAEPVAEEAPIAEEKPKRKRAPRKTKAAAAAEAEAADAAEAPTVEAPAVEAPAAEAPVEAEAEAEAAKPAPKKRASRAKKAVAAEAAAQPATAGEAEPVAADADGEGEGPDGEPRRGWWQRTFGN
ncbi:ribonuclease [Sphingopyxis sp. H038]|nr:ribonuclease [Sphingopyxis sp. H012]KTE09421.1 ribonuclease [Sphingopyxis sp. H053]KTE14951.1 ribonuclease [Sphingopyxis sp. H093]KTE25012.1 ribonuclease [Sphingopyxis sp. H080]KTE35285.1 ribonuclease [Sphingopyxis sp. H038]KTE44152.1 ribonuclease [Sphingopyxis sp. H005]KTE47981.1 ribonuclease [Sphingopyxis sp. H077]KTE69311.1 ribonuclease [Sphingopyxis sp. H085]